MKTRRLAETDLANFCLLPEKQMRKAMFEKVDIAVGYTLEPVRTLTPDLMNEVGDLLSTLSKPEPTAFGEIERRLSILCHSHKEYTKNLEVAWALKKYFDREKPVSHRIRIPDLAVGVGERVHYWLPYYYVSDGIPVLTFVDPRGSGGLTPLGRHVVHSLMHNGVRVADPDFHDAVLRVLRVPVSGVVGRYTSTFDHNGEELIEFDKLNAAIQFAYRVWAEVQAAKDAAKPPKKYPGQGSFF